MARTLDTLVIGAGPAGLAAARALREHNVPYTQVERHGAALAQARNVMIEDRVTRLTSDEFARLEHALEREPQALPQLTKLLQPTTDRERPAPATPRTKTPSGRA